MLEIHGISKSYPSPDGRFLALEGFSLEANAGDFVSVQGPSGCGKTTLLLTAGGLLAPDRGRVLVAGDDIYALSPEERAALRARKIGFVFQQFHLIPYLDVLDNVLAPALALSAFDARERARELLARFGLESRKHHVPAALSTGEKQRTAMARALLNSPKLLLADEPTGNLDRDNAEVVLEHMKDFAAEGGTVLLVTHDSSAAARAGRSIRIDKGRLAGTADSRGTPPSASAPGAELRTDRETNA